MPLTIHRLCSTASARADGLKLECFNQLPDWDVNDIYQYDTDEKEQDRGAACPVVVTDSTEKDNGGVRGEEAGEGGWMIDCVKSERIGREG